MLRRLASRLVSRGGLALPRTVQPLAGDPATDPRRLLPLQQQVVQYLSALAETSACASASPYAAAQRPGLVVAPSTIPGAGRGVFLAPGSAVPPGGIVTLYPGN